MRRPSAAIALLLGCYLSVAQAVRPPPPPAFSLEGACAGIKQRETWKSATGEPHWSYRIKVHPWTLFGRVRVQMHGWDMQLTKNYSAAVPNPVGRDITAILHPRPGLDDTFQILGTGEPYADPDLSCTDLQEANATTGDCPLGPVFHVESDWDSLQTGRFRANVQLNMWVLQTIITLDFGEGTTVSIGRDMSGARLTDGGDGSSSRAEVSLLPLKHCLGMYKDVSCDNAFGFSAVVAPNMRTLPRISCLLTRDMPAPPPPSPPFPPPSPPPGFIIDPNLCYLGGTAHYVIAPHKVAAQAALQTWVVAIHLNEWHAGERVVVDFPGVMHAEHGLHVHSIYPAEVARLVSVTRHSAIVELLPTAARDFRFEALGDVDDAQKDVTPYAIKAAEYVRAARMKATKTPLGRKVLMKVTTSSIGAQIMTLEARYLGLPGAERGLQVAPAGALAVASNKAKGKKKKGGRKADDEEEEQEEPLVGQPTLDGFDDDDDEDSDEDEKDESGGSGKMVAKDSPKRKISNNMEDEEDEDDMEAPPVKPSRASTGRGKPNRSKASSSSKIELIVKTESATKRHEVDLRHICDMSELQQLVGNVCKRLGVDMAGGGLRMQYTDMHGQTHVVSRSTPIDSIRAASSLLLVPKETKGAAKQGNGGSGGRSARSGGRKYAGGGMMDD